MMKNTEWGGLVYLSHSKYGINKEVRNNNNTSYITACGANIENGSITSICQIIYGESDSYPQSTTGNISGVFDTSDGAWEYVAAYRSGTFGSSGFTASTIESYDSKYFDIYDASSTVGSYQNRILGDATGELGPFYHYQDSDGTSRYHNNWYGDIAGIVDSSYPWFIRGGNYSISILNGQFALARDTGAALSGYTYRIVLIPIQ